MMPVMNGVKGFKQGVRIHSFEDVPSCSDANEHPDGDIVRMSQEDNDTKARDLFLQAFGQMQYVPALGIKFD